MQPHKFSQIIAQAARLPRRQCAELTELLNRQLLKEVARGRTALAVNPCRA